MTLKGLVLALLLIVAVPANGIVRGFTPDDKDTRFDAVGAFATSWRLGFPYDPPPIESGDNNWYCSAVLVTPTVIVTAKHCALAYGQAGLTYPHAIRFRRQTDGSIGTIKSGPSSFYHAFIDHFVLTPPEYDDVAFGVLTAPVTHISAIPLIPFDPSNTERIPEPFAAFIAGWGKEGPESTEGPQTRLNVCQTLVSAPPAFISANPLTYPSAYLEPFPCGSNSGDSGGGILRMSLKTGAVLGIMGVINYSTGGVRVPPLAVIEERSKGR